MIGVEILKTQIVYKENYDGVILGLIIGLTLLLLGIVLMNSKVNEVVWLLSVSIGITLIILCPIFVKTVPSGEYEYTVTIDKGVDLVTFNEVYDIVRQEDKLYIIRERSNMK